MNTPEKDQELGEFLDEMEQQEGKAVAEAGDALVEELHEAADRQSRKTVGEELDANAQGEFRELMEKPLNLLETMAHKYGHEAPAYRNALKATCLSTLTPPPTEGEVDAFLTVCNRYDLDPLCAQIYAFRKQGGGLQPVLGVDGWIQMIHRIGADGITFDEIKDGDDRGVTCAIHRKGAPESIAVTEWLSECKRKTGPWNSHPRRMLRHKALIQCARVAMGLGGLVDPDEAEAIQEGQRNTPGVPQGVSEGAPARTIDDLLGGPSDGETNS